MKTFKQFISENNEPVLIVNTHGSHSISKSDQNPYFTEGFLSKLFSKPEKHWNDFSKQNFNPHVSKPKFNAHVSQIMDVQKTHPLNPDSHDHLRNWTNHSADLTKHFLNSHKENKNPVPEDNSLVHGHDIKALDKSITDHRLKHKLTTFTGTSFNPQKVDSNKVISHLSSSMDPSVAHQFTVPEDINGQKVHHIIKHDLPKGFPAAVIGSQKHHSGEGFITKHVSEREVLLPRTDATKEKYHLHFNGYKDYKHDDGSIIRVHNGEWKPTR